MFEIERACIYLCVAEIPHFISRSGFYSTLFWFLLSIHLTLCTSSDYYTGNSFLIKFLTYGNKLFILPIKDIRQTNVYYLLFLSFHQKGYFSTKNWIRIESQTKGQYFMVNTSGPSRFVGNLIHFSHLWNSEALSWAGNRKTSEKNISVPCHIVIV